MDIYFLIGLVLGIIFSVYILLTKLKFNLPEKTYKEFERHLLDEENVAVYLIALAGFMLLVAIWPLAIIYYLFSLLAFLRTDPKDTQD